MTRKELERLLSATGFPYSYLGSERVYYIRCTFSELMAIHKGIKRENLQLPPGTILKRSVLLDARV
jgi:hypothetical protein